ncbi:MAG TPA: hypothetical protein VEQ60_31780 [Longimicrobium sp.]|nr:hypothetical protein [Longimicrobium sp.]
MRPRAAALLLLLALTLTGASAAYQRVGARRMVEGEAWCSTPAPCQIRALGAGFPLPYLVDDPQVSVPNAIGIGEDDFLAGAFLIDVLVWFALAILALWMIRGRKRTAAPVDAESGQRV